MDDLVGRGVDGVAEGDGADAALVSRIAAGDRRALETLYMRHHARVYRFIRRFDADQANAEDIANDVFLDIWQRAAGFEGRSRVTSWMLGIARFKALSARRGRKPSVDPDDALSEMDDGSDTPEVAVQKLDKGAALKRCIANLPEEHRLVVDLVYYQEMSVAEAAAILDVPENTVKTRMFHARKKLSAMMEQAGIDRGWP